MRYWQPAFLFTGGVKGYLTGVTKQNDDSTSFGYREMKEKEKEPLVECVFNGGAGRYDIMSDLMSMGAQRIWKDALMEWM